MFGFLAGVATVTFALIATVLFLITRRSPL